MSARDDAIATIRSEHNSIAAVLEALKRIVDEMAERRREPDFALLSRALYYFDDFPERCHHPKEDEFLFKALRRRTADLDEVLDALQAEHIRSGQMVGYLERALVHYQGGAPDGLERFRAAVMAYAAMQEGHMRAEERVLKQAGDYLRGEDWSAMAAAFAVNVDPLSAPGEGTNYGRLYAGILTLLPSKLRGYLRAREPSRAD